MKILIGLFLYLLSVPISGQVCWQHSVINYSRHEYRASNQNWKIVQHPNGWMYFSNNNGLLEFDGVYWNTYRLPHHEKVRSLAIGPDNKIYVGGLGQFGYFSPNLLGGLDYTSLSGQLRNRDRENIWNVLVSGDKVYFQSDCYIYCFSNGHIRAIDCNGCNLSAIVNGQLFFMNTFGLNRVNGNSVEHIQDSDFLRDLSVVAMLPFKGRLMLVTSHNGLWLYSNGTFTRFRSSLDAFCSTNHLSCASADGTTLALGTMDDGVIIYDILRDKAERVSVAGGLQNKTVLSLSFDHEHNLWLGLDNGIDYIALNSPLYFLYSKYSSIGSGYCALPFENKLYLGTNQGLYTTSVPTSLDHRADIRPVAGAEGQIHCLKTIDGSLFCGGRKVFYRLKDGLLTKYNLRGVWNVDKAGHSQKAILVGTYWGISVLRKSDNGEWNMSNDILDLNISAKSMLVEEGSPYVWLGNKKSGVWRIKLDDKLQRAVRKKCYNSKRLPIGDNVCIGYVNGNITIASRQGLFKYNSIQDKLEKANQLEAALDGNVPYTYIHEDAAGRIWYVTDGLLKQAVTDRQTGQIRKTNSSPLLDDYLMEDFENVEMISKQEVVVGIEDGFALLNSSTPTAAVHRFNLQIRRVYLTNGGDSLIYGKSIAPNSSEISIPYGDNSLRIEYGADHYSRTQAVLYSYRLIGSNDETWSTYNRATTKEYTDLPEGTYTFQVRLGTAGIGEASVSSFTFRILPPWYRSWWAYTAYGLMVIAACRYLYVRYKSGRERLIRMKDSELMRQKQSFERDITDKEAQIGRLEKEKLRSELQLKSNELVQSTLNIVRKNEVLRKIRTEAETLAELIAEGNRVALRRALLRLIGQIETNIEHDQDMENFQRSFDIVNHDFFKKLDAQFPTLTYKEKILCVYVRMNLMSKEIAPLMNISIRGVEISRYRLRKKLGLDEKANLADFLQHV